MSKFHSLKVKDVSHETSDAVSIAFEIPDRLASEFQFLPGQYLTLRTTIDGQDIRRAYSICSVSEDDLRVGIKRVQGGIFSTFAQDLSVGDELLIMPPQGSFICNTDHISDRNILLIAAGSGVTPILSIASHVLADEPDSNVTLIYGNQATNSIMFKTQLEEMKDSHLTRFHMYHVLSREVQDVDLFSGRIDTARIKAMIDKKLFDPFAQDEIYICGPQEMSESLCEYFSNLGVDQEHIHVELFEATKPTGEVKVSTEIKEVVEKGVQIDVIFDGLRRQIHLTDPKQTVLEAAQSSGLDLPFSCAGGMCATCRCKVIEGEAEMDKNFSLAEWEVEKGFALCCQLRPKSSSLVIDFDAA